MRPHEPWIRLAQAHIIMGQNEKACQLLITASDYEPWLWQVWRDITVMSAKCTHFAKAASSYHNALKINPHYGNEEILKRIVSSLVNGNLEKDYHSQVRTAACKLLEELNRIFPNNTHFWALLGVVLASEPNCSKIIRADAVNKLKKAIEIIQSPYNRWYVHDSLTPSTLKASQLIVDCLVNTGCLLRGTKEGSTCLQMALAYINYVTGKLEDFHSDFLTRLHHNVKTLHRG